MLLRVHRWIVTEQPVGSKRAAAGFSTRPCEWVQPASASVFVRATERIAAGGGLSPIRLESGSGASHSIESGYGSERAHAVGTWFPTSRSDPACAALNRMDLGA